MVDAVAGNLPNLLSMDFSTESDIAADLGGGSGRQIENAIQGDYHGNLVTMHHATRQSMWMDDEPAIGVIVALVALPGFDRLRGALGPPICAKAINKWQHEYHT